MFPIFPATPSHASILAEIGAQTFVESHGHSAPAQDIAAYLSATYREEAFRAELSNPRNAYHLIYHEGELAGYSNLILNAEHPNIEQLKAAKLERLYLLQRFHGSGVGEALFRFNVGLAQANGQTGLWLFVWKENHRAIRFYAKNGFEIVGSHDFRLSETHTNPNHQLLLRW